MFEYLEDLSSEDVSYNPWDSIDESLDNNDEDDNEVH
jgi:hypothetical protein